MYFSSFDWQECISQYWTLTLKAMPLLTWRCCWAWWGWQRWHCHSWSWGQHWRVCWDPRWPPAAPAGPWPWWPGQTPACAPCSRGWWTTLPASSYLLRYPSSWWCGLSSGEERVLNNIKVYLKASASDQKPLILGIKSCWVTMSRWSWVEQVVTSSDQGTLITETRIHDSCSTSPPTTALW